MGITLVRVCALLCAIGMIDAKAALGQSSAAKRDSSLLAVSVAHTTHFETRESLLGPWKNTAWAGLLWRIDAGKTPEEVVLTRFLDDGRFEIYRGDVLHCQDASRTTILDLTPLSPSAPAEGKSVAHTIFKVSVDHVNSYSLGTPSGMRKEFNGKLAKAYDRLTLTPLKKDALRELKDAPAAITARESSEAPPGPPLAAFLVKEGGRSELWAKSSEMTGFQKRGGEAAR